jgi:Tfp pilus assembly protein PilV
MLKFRRSSKKQAGDTLIEVLFAVTVFSFIVVSALSLMNQGVNAAQRSLEITTVRQQMDAQAETLRFLHKAYVNAYQTGYAPASTDLSPAAEYYRLIQFVKNGDPSGTNQASTFGGNEPCKVAPFASRSFVLNPVSAKYITGVIEPADTYAQIVYSDSSVVKSSKGIWLEAVRPRVENTISGFIDFHIRACWDVTGSDIPQNLGTIVRLYEPRG